MDHSRKHQEKLANKTIPVGEAQEREAFFRLIVEHSGDAMLVIDRKGIVRFLNPAAERLFNRSTEQMVGQMFGFPVYTDEPQELDIIGPERDSRVAEMRVVETELHGETLYVASLRDITKQVRLREGLRNLSITDELTGLHNRRAFIALAQQQLKLADRANREMVLLFADFDHFKWINDTQGHHEGDLALIETANILKETFRESDIIARIGGDEFVVLAIEARKGSAKILAARLQETLAAHNAKGNRRYKLSLSVGATRYDPECPCSIDELLERADRLMYEHKQSKR